MALKRLYVSAKIFDDVVDGLSAVMTNQTIGDGLQDGVTLGPLNNLKQRKIVEAMIEEAQTRGEDVRFFGKIHDEAQFSEGYFLRPSLIVNASHDLSAVKDEQFGPTLPIIAYDSEDEAVHFANDSSYGLSSSVWSQDTNRAMTLARRLEAGFTNINGHGPTAMDGLSPFGGVKQSGIGRNFGVDGIKQFQDVHSISVPLGNLLD